MLLSRSADERYAPLTYRHLRVIQAVAQHGGIGRAAEILFMSQPAVTRALQQAEDLLGVKLFDRTPNGVMPTIFAEPVLKRAQSIHAAMRETERDLEKLRDPDANRLRIGAGIHSTEVWGNRAVASLVLDNPDLKISIANYDWHDLIADLLNSKIDYGIGEIGELVEHSDVTVEPLAELDLHFVCGAHHPLVAIEAPQIDDIVCFPMVGNKLVSRLGARFHHNIGRLGEIDFDTGGVYPAIRVTSLNAIKYVLIESDALALMPIESVRAELASGSLVALSRQAMPWLFGKIGFIMAASRRMTPLMKAFRNAVLTVQTERLRSGIETETQPRSRTNSKTV